jgi:hypothetical protein
MQPGGEAEQAFEAPMMREFNEQIIPGLSEQFAGMGSGGLNSSSFRNAAVNAGQSLSERLAQMRQGLRMQGAQGIQGMMGTAFSPTQSNVFMPGIMPSIVGALGRGIGGAFGGF